MNARNVRSSVHRRRDYVAPDGRWRPLRPEGLARVIAKAGYGARHRAEDMVREGRVSVDGTTVRDPGCPVDAGSHIRLDGQVLREVPRRYFVLHKPTALDCRAGGRSDTLAAFLPGDVPGLEPVGRLDARTGGLLLISNDPWWCADVSAQRRLEQEFEIRVAGELGEMELGIILGGMHLHNLGYIKGHRAQILGRAGSGTLLRLTVRSGKLRQVRRMFATLRHEVQELTRVRIGSIKLGNLPVGHLRQLTRAEIRIADFSNGVVP